MTQSGHLVLRIVASQNEVEFHSAELKSLLPCEPLSARSRACGSNVPAHHLLKLYCGIDKKPGGEPDAICKICPLCPFGNAVSDLRDAQNHGCRRALQGSDRFV